ncbi:adenine nucleotide alpha hydrolases-like protein, partial [Trematosphaeria pertusa]
MASSLKVIALISGGKDSLFSILHCLANGHAVVALANLYPPPTPDDDDLNSYMYQTVGHAVIPLYEEALGIPLYREEIRGSAANSSRDYTAQEDDETESLVPLLKRIKEAHPEANAVSTGAIFSTYQRTRVESVAVRLGLTPLSYLWQYPYLPPYTQSSLLCDMEAVGQDARIIKVASGGLDDGFLWANVADSRTVARMKKALARFSEDGDGALVGEGGEFETLAVDGPSLLWRKRIEVEPDRVVHQSGGTAIWHGKNAHVVDKPLESFKLEDLRRPPLFDDEFLDILRADMDTSAGVISLPPDLAHHTAPPTNNCAKTQNAFVYSNITGETAPGLASEVKAQMANIFLRLDHALAAYDISKQDIVHCTLLLRRMSDFASANDIYSQYFDYTNPPARATVAVGDCMPNPLDVTLSVFAEKDSDRKGLHVQSQSYWAPANIGPYSQAISTMLPPRDRSAVNGTEDLHAAGRIVHIAGQIPLVPASMKLFTPSLNTILEEDSFKGEAVLALQHLFRIGRTQGVKWWTAGLAMLPSIPSAKEQEKRVLLAQALWKAIHAPPSPTEDQSAAEEELDAWDLKNLLPTFQDTSRRPAIPHRNSILSSSSSPADPPPTPPCFVADISALPRAANIEWLATGLAASSIAVRQSDYPLTHFTQPDPQTASCAARFCAREI